MNDCRRVVGRHDAGEVEFRRAGAVAREQEIALFDISDVDDGRRDVGEFGSVGQRADPAADAREVSAVSARRVEVRDKLERILGRSRTDAQRAAKLMDVFLFVVPTLRFVMSGRDVDLDVVPDGKFSENAAPLV